MAYPYRSNVHGVLDLEVGQVWEMFGHILYLTDWDLDIPEVKEAIDSRRIVLSSGSEVTQARFDTSKKVGPKPAAPVLSPLMLDTSEIKAKLFRLENAYAVLSNAHTDLFNQYTNFKSNISIEMEFLKGFILSLTEAQNKPEVESVPESIPESVPESVPESMEPVESVPESMEPVESVPESMESVPESMESVESVPESMESLSESSESNRERNKKKKHK